MKKTILTALVLTLGLVAGVADAGYVLGTPEYCIYGAGPNISADGLSLYCHAVFPESTGIIGYGREDLWIIPRPTAQSGWDTLINLGEVVNGPERDIAPEISADGLKLYFDSLRPGGSGENDLWVTTRPTADDPWGQPENLGPIVNSPGFDLSPSLSTDELELYFHSDRPGGSGHEDLWVTKRPTTDDPWGQPENLGAIVNSASREMLSSISSDGLTLFFTSDRAGGQGGADLWMTTRPTKDDPWREPKNLGPIVNGSLYDIEPDISPDGSTLYFASNRPNPYSAPLAIWSSQITLQIDLNGDNFIDREDVRILVEHWGTNEPSCDLAPPPLGDGIVDVKDLVVLAEHLFEDVRVIAHWKMDETEGGIACDSAGSHDAILNGNPLWQPAAGRIDGALEFDGLDDYAVTPFVLDAEKSPFSASAWIKGAMPGQTIIAQTDGTGFGGTWLGMNPADGTLLSTLMFVELKSESLIPDDQWHHVALVWDGSYRVLYLDGTQVAADSTALSYALSCDGGLNIGADKDLTDGSFFAGQIDDVRIYNVALSAEEIQELAQ